MPYPRLNKPPIDEVVCGFVFAPVNVDILDYGVYRDMRRAEFPRHSLHPLVSDGQLTIQLGPPQQRIWLLKESDDIILQLQFDRFYMNWRKRDQDYPRFSDWGEQIGLKSQAIREFRTYSDFLKKRTNQNVNLLRVEVTKIDSLHMGVHYENMQELSSLLRVATVFQDIQVHAPTQLLLKLVETDAKESSPITHLSIAIEKKQTRIETRVVVHQPDDEDQGLQKANARANEVFFGLLNQEKFNIFELQGEVP